MAADRTREPTRTTALDGPVRPGALTALLAELARGPAGAGWDLPAVPGETIGRFEIVREVGRGGFGVVYEARDGELGRSVAFKAVRATGDPAREQRALAEAEAAARLAHPNIVHLYDVGRCERGPYLILELLRGETLDERLGRGPLPAREAVRVAVEIARGLAHAHGQGVVHRDLKPGNVFVCEDGQVKVLDFGLAHVFGKGGLSGGTPAYMAPEQAAGESGDERSDVYALGVLLHEVVTGRLPFEGKEAGIAEGEKAPELRGVPAALSKLVGRMLAREPAGRPASGAEVLAQLVAIQKGMEPRRLLWAALAVAVAAVIGAGVFAWLWQRPLPQGRLLTAIADTDNRTGDPDLDAVSELLRVGLEQSRRLSVMARSRLVNLLTASGGAPASIGEGEARAAARSARAQLLVVPEVREAAGGYALEVRLVEPDRGEIVGAARERAVTKATVPDALDRLVRRVRAELREGPDDTLGAPVRISDAAPSDPEAWRHYAEWKRLSSEGRSKAAADAMDRLLVADPDFPIARVLKAVTSEEDLEEGARQIEAALRGVARLPPKERALVEAMAVPFRGGSQHERLLRLDAVIAGWPEEPLAHLWAGNILLHQYADASAARPYLERALSTAPLSPGARLTFLVALGRLDDALAVASRWAEEAPSAGSLTALSQVYRWRGDVGEALEAARRSLPFETPPGRGARWAWVHAGAVEELEAMLQGTPGPHDPHWLALRGRWREALATFDAGAPGASASPSARGWHHFLRADLLANGFGDPEAVWREVREMLLSPLPMGDGELVPLAVAGDAGRALRILGGRTHEGSGSFRMVEAFDRWRRGDREGALRGFEGVLGLGSGLRRGELLAEMGRDREAIEALRRYRRLIDFPWGEMRYTPFTTAAGYPRSLYLEAAALERLGERDEGLATVRRLLRLWKDADPGLSLLREARALERRLAATR